MARERPNAQKMIGSLRGAALSSYATGDEMMEMVRQRELRMLGHDCGHQFTITFTSAMHAGISGEGPESHIDSDWDSEPKTVTVRATDLPAALRRAAALPLTAWYGEEEDD